MVGRSPLLGFVVMFFAVALAEAQPVASPLPDDGPHTPAYKQALLALRDRLKQTPAPPVTAKEQVESVEWMLKANPDIKHTLVGHHVIVMATEGFAARAEKSDFLLNFDLGYEVMMHLWGTDPTARVGRRFFIWPDPGRDGGHNCNGRDLRIAVGRSDRDNAEWFERYFHEMTHGFQFGHPAQYLMVNGFFEGWAEFMQAVVCDHLAPLRAPFTGRFEWYSTHFPESGRVEYLQTRLPIEEIVAYDPSAGLLMELVNTTKDAASHPDWAPIRRLLRDSLKAPRWTPWHLWPAMMARDCMTVFGEEKARPILARYRFPLDHASLDAAQVQNSGVEKPNAAPREPVAGDGGWLCIGPLSNPKRMGFEWNPLDAENMAWRWREVAPESPQPPIDAAHAEQWKPIKPDGHNIIQLDGPTGGPEFFYLATTLPKSLRTKLTFYIGSDDDCAIWLDGQLIHLFRGNRACTPDYPDIAYADATGGKGQIVVLVVNHGGRSAFSLAVAKGGLLFDGFEERFTSADPRERAAETAYLASRRHQQPVARLLERAARDTDPAVRAAAKWWPDRRPMNGGDFKEAEEAYSRGSIGGGFYWNNSGSSGNQCVARAWGGASSNWLSLPLEAKKDGPHHVRIRYACPNESSLRVRVRRGDHILFTSEPLKMKATGKDWSTWGWHNVAVPSLERGIYQIELIDPANAPDIDIIGLVAR